MSSRLLKVNELLRQEVAKLLEQEVEWPPGCLVTVTKVKTLPDLKISTIFLSVFPIEQAAGALRLAKKSAPDIQQILNEGIKMYRIPKLKFVLDTTEAEAENIEKVLDGNLRDTSRKLYEYLS